MLNLKDVVLFFPGIHNETNQEAFCQIVHMLNSCL